MEAVFSKQYDILRLPEELANQVQHTQGNIKRGKGRDAIRKIFGGGAKYDSFEMEKLNEMDSYLKGQQRLHDISYLIHSLLPVDKKMRFLYSNNFDIKKTVENVARYTEWTMNSDNFLMNEQVLEILKKGVIYFAGRGKQFRPCITINIGIIDLKQYPFISLMRAINIVLVVAQEYMLYPGKVENWIVFLETMERSLINIPYQTLKALIQVLSQNFPQYLEKLYIIHPSTSLQVSWTVIEEFIPQKSKHKIEFVTEKNYQLLFKYFLPSQIENKYRGSLPNVKQFWPPISTVQKSSDAMPKKSIMFKMNQIGITDENADFDDQMSPEEYSLFQITLTKRLSSLKNMHPNSSLISNDIQKKFQKSKKPKNKIYKEETFVDYSEYDLTKRLPVPVLIKQSPSMSPARSVSARMSKIFSPNQTRQELNQEFLQEFDRSQNNKIFSSGSPPIQEEVLSSQSEQQSDRILENNTPEIIAARKKTSVLESDQKKSLQKQPSQQETGYSSRFQPPPNKQQLELVLSKLRISANQIYPVVENIYVNNDFQQERIDNTLNSYPLEYSSISQTINFQTRNYLIDPISSYSNNIPSDNIFQKVEESKIVQIQNTYPQQQFIPKFQIKDFKFSSFDQGDFQNQGDSGNRVSKVNGEYNACWIF